MTPMRGRGVRAGRASGPRASRALRSRLAVAYDEAGAPGPGRPLVIALSGGVDSCALLHVLRFGGTRGPSGLVAAHFDHAMRPGSEADARWVAGLCRAWGVRLVDERADPAPRNEEAARDARYAFLERVRRDTGASHVVTAHHADDQAETVLFRLLRGTGLAGLRGIRTVRGGTVWRPFLRARRREIAAYASAVGLAWRDDPSNARTDLARNAIRHRILPDAERLVSASAVPALVSVAQAAEEDEEAWASLMPGLVDSLGTERRGGRISADRAALRALHAAVRARVIRAVARELGAVPGREATRAAVAFVREAPSGRRLDLGGGLVLGRELDRIVWRAGQTTPASHGPWPSPPPVEIPDAGAGSGQIMLAGRAILVAWGAEGVPDGHEVARFDPAALRFPLRVRAWEPGDRIRLRAGSRKLKKVFLDARVPVPRRHGTPVVADAAGEVLWVPGVVRSEVAPEPAGAPFTVGVRRTAPAIEAGSDR